MPVGPRAHCDAALNPSLVGSVAGLGIWLHNPASPVLVYIQATSLYSDSVLQAEAQAMVLVVFAAQALYWTNDTVLTDCKTPAEAAAANDLLSEPGH